MTKTGEVRSFRIGKGLCGEDVEDFEYPDDIPSSFWATDTANGAEYVMVPRATWKEIESQLGAQKKGETPNRDKAEEAAALILAWYSLDHSKKSVSPEWKKEMVGALEEAHQEWVREHGGPPLPPWDKEAR